VGTAGWRSTTIRNASAAFAHPTSLRRIPPFHFPQFFVFTSASAIRLGIETGQDLLRSARKAQLLEGCSTGGRQDLDLAEKHGEDFDGFVVGAPATYLSEFALAKAWPRPLCPWPKTAIYNGSGPTTEASSYHCGGDLDAWPPSKDTNNVATVCVGLHTRYQHETSDDLNYAEQGISPDQCPGPDHRH
jgi:pimeloyl-ACP methyl ester carboxylesterase